MIRNKGVGFTLIEILLVMAIIVILASGSYVGFVSFNRAQSLNIARDTLYNTFNEARSSAMSQVIISCSQNQTLFGYQIRFNTAYYDIEEVCRDVNLPNNLTNSRVKRVPLPGDVTFYPNPSSPILFLLTGGISGGADRSVILRNTASQTKTIIVSAGGVITTN